VEGARAWLGREFAWQVQAPVVVTDKFGDAIGPQLVTAQTGNAQQAIIEALSDAQLNVLAAALGAQVVPQPAGPPPAGAAAAKAAEDAYKAARTTTVLGILNHVSLANYRVAYRTVAVHGRAPPPPPPPPPPTAQEAAAAAAAARELVKINAGPGGFNMSVSTYNAAVGKTAAVGAEFTVPFAAWTATELPGAIRIIEAAQVAESERPVVSDLNGWTFVNASPVRALKLIVVCAAARMQKAGVNVGFGMQEPSLDSPVTVQLPVADVSPYNLHAVLKKPWGDSVRHVTEPSTPADRAKITKVADAAMTGLDHLLQDYLRRNGADTKDVGPPLRFWFQFVCARSLFMLPPGAEAGDCWTGLMEPFEKHEAREVNAALLARTEKATKDALAALAAAEAQRRGRAYDGGGAKRERGDDHGSGGGAPRHDNGAGKSAKRETDKHAKQDAKKKASSIRADPHCVQYPDEKMTADICPIHGRGHKRGECRILVKPGLLEISDVPDSAAWKAYVAAHKCNITPGIGQSFKDANP
jgi:hypothetical protein